MDKLIDTLENNRLLKQILGMQARHNKPTDFIKGEEVVTLNPIDIWDTIKPGSIGFINTIMHRYKGKPAEHHEFWIISNGVKSRYETHQILKIDIVRQFMVDYKE
tara:strand:+ start:151 stop:465 length:315 start_codon:yes stop_codon:yes gene_type:complete